MQIDSMKTSHLMAATCACVWLGVWLGLADPACSRAESSTNSPTIITSEAGPAPSIHQAALSGSTNRAAGLRMDFHHAALDQILDYLSDAAGLIIHKEDDLKADLDVSSQNSLTCDEAVQLLNSSLKKSGGAVFRDGRILTVTRLDAAKTSDLEVVSGSEPGAVEKSDQVITQIIPVHYANASQLLNNLQVLLPGTATLTANESANALILVATKTQIRRMLRIVSAIDTSMARVSSVRILTLRYADAKQLASAIQQLFPSQSSSQNGRGTGGFNFPGGFGPPGTGGPMGAGSDSASSTSSGSGAKVTVVAEEQSNSLVVTAPPESMTAIVRLTQEIDQPVADITEIRVFNLKNADPTELADQLAQLFPDSNSSSSRGADQNQSPVQFGGGPTGAGGPGGGGGPGGFGGGGPGGFGGGLGASSGSETSTRAKKRGSVLAVPDARTSSLLVTAASALMPQIARLIQELDASSARKEVVKVYELRNADPQDINTALQDLFHRNSSTANNNNNNRTSLLGQGNPLTTRQTQQQNSSSTSSTGFGSSSGGGGGAGGGGP